MSKTEIGIILTADGRLAQAGLAQVEQGLARMGTQGAQASKQLQQGIDRASNSLSDFVGHAARLTLVTQGISGIASALNALPKAAFDYTKNLETSAVGMAGIMASVTALNGQQLEYNQALGVSQDMIRKLGDDALRTAASSQELVGAFQALLAPGLAAGMKLDEIRQLTTVGTNAVKSIGLQGTQVVQELRDLVAGGITASSSTLATALGLKDADIAKAKASAQGLFAFLMERLKGFESSSEAFGQTLQGRMDTLKEGATRVAADGMKPLTDEISRTVGAMGQLLVTFDGAGKATINPELVNGLRGVSEGLVAAMNAGKAAVGVLYEHRDAVGTLAAAYAALKLGGMVSDWTRATAAKIELMQASRLAAVQAAAEGASNTALTLTSRQKTAALLSELQANVQKTAAQAAATVGTAAAIQAEQAHANAVRQLTVAQDAASVSGRAMGAVIGALGGPVGIAITALTGLAFWIGSVSQKAEAAANLALKYQRASGAAAQGKAAEAGDIAAMQAYANQLREVRDSSLQAGDAIRTFRNAKGELTYAKGSQMDPLIAKVEADIKAVTAASEKSGQAQGQLTLTLAGARQAWEASVGGIKTASSVQDDYTQKLGASQRAYQEYRAVLVATGADQASISAAATKQAQAEKALGKERDAALKSLNKTTGNASATSRDYARAVDAGLASLQARTSEELIYSAALAQHGTEADKMLSGEREVLKLRNELTIATAGLAQATTKDGRSKIETRIATLNLHMAEAVRLADVQRQNQITKESLELGQKAINDLQKQADAIRDKTAALAEENAAYGQINPTLAKALAQSKDLAGQMVMTDGSVMDYERAQRAAEAWSLMNGYIGQLMKQDWNKINGAVQEWQRSATEQAALYEDEARLSGLTALERAKVVAARQVELKLAKQIAEIERAQFSEDPVEDAAQKAKLIADATTAAQTESSAAVAKVVQEDWTRTSEKIEEVLIDALMDGGKSGAEYIEGLFRTMVLRPVLQAIVSPVAGAVTSALGFSGAPAAGGGLMGMANTASSLNNLYNMGASAANWLGLGTATATGLGLSAAMGTGTALAATGTGLGLSAGLGAGYGFAAGGGLGLTAASAGAGTIGAGLGTSAAVTGSTAAAGGAMSTVGAAMPWVAGGLAIDQLLLGGKVTSSISKILGFGDDKPKYRYQTGGGDFEDKVSVAGVYGNIGMNDNGSKNIKAADFTETFQAIADLDATIAATLSPDQNSQIKAALNNYVSGKNESTADYVADRMKIMADVIGGGVNELVDQFGGTSEELVNYLLRLTQAQPTIDALAFLGKSLGDTEAAALSAALAMEDLVGGQQNLLALTGSFYQNFYTEAERTAHAMQALIEALASIGVDTVPATREAFRDLVDAQDRTTESGRETYAALLGLNGAFAALVPVATELSTLLGGLGGTMVDETITAIDKQIEASNRAGDAAREAADKYRDAARSLLDVAMEIRYGAADNGAAQAYADVLSKAQGGDLTAMQGLGQSATVMLEQQRGRTSSAAEYAILAAQTANQLQQVSAVADVSASGADYQAMLYDVNTAALEVLKEGLLSGNVTQDLLQKQLDAIEALGTIISDSAQLTIKHYVDESGLTRTGIFDAGGLMVSSVDAATADQLLALATQTTTLAGKIDTNRDGVVTAQELASALVSGQISKATTDQMLAIATQTTAQTTALDTNKNGVVTAQELAAGLIAGKVSTATQDQLLALATQTTTLAGSSTTLGGTFTNALSGQTTTINSVGQSQITALGLVQTEQQKTISATDVVAQVTGENVSLSDAILAQLKTPDASAEYLAKTIGLGNDYIAGRLDGIIAAINQQTAEQQAELKRQQDLQKAQAEAQAAQAAQAYADALSLAKGISSTFSGRESYRYQTGGSNFEDKVSVAGVYGNIGMNDGGSYNITASTFSKTFQDIAKLDAAIAATLSPEQNAKIKTALNGYVSGQNESTADYVSNRLGVILRTVGTEASPFVEKLIQDLGGVPAFHTGGYTGPGGKYEAAGVVHRGEVVFSQDDIARLGGVRAVEAIRTGTAPGYADGGVVGSASGPVVVPAPLVPGRVTMAPRPATPDPVQQEREAQARDQAQREAQQQTQDLIAQLRQVNSNLTELKRSVDKSGQSNDQMNNKIFNMADTTVKLLRKFDSMGLPVVDVTPAKAAAEAA